MSSNLRDKLSAYETNPPDRVWEEISASLDHQKPGTFVQRLLEYEVSPPSTLWSKIQSGLIKLEKFGPGVVPFYKKYRTHLRYTGVAAILITFGIISSLLISKKTVSEVPSNQTVHQAPPSQKEINARETVPGNKHGSGIASLSMRPGILQERISRQLHMATDNTMAFLEHVAPKYVQPKQTINFSLPSEAYMIYSDGEGNAVRLPKRLYDAFVCPDDKITCRQRLKKLQEKIASSSITSDLTGMLETLNNLQENQ